MWHAREWTDKNSWNAFLLAQPTQTGLFQQSWEWLDFQNSLGRSARYVVLMSEEKQYEPSAITAVLGLTHLPLPFGMHYWYSPRGPIAHEGSNADEFLGIFNELKKYLRKNVIKSTDIFWRHEPLSNIAPLHRGIGGYGKTQRLEATALKTSSGAFLIHGSEQTQSVQPDKTSAVDISQEDDALFAKMHEKTRYNIRLAIKKGVHIVQAAPTKKTMGEFLQLLVATAARNGFRAHETSYYQRMSEDLGVKSGREHLHLRLAMAYHDNKPIAGALLGYFGDTVTYLHGASDHEARNLMAPYVLHWEIMRAARTVGYTQYDLWGIDEKRFPGVTRFKLGFGGHPIQYPGTFDLPVHPMWYKLYRAARSLRRM